MRSFDDELKKALVRLEPSEDFGARVLARVAAEKARSKPAEQSRPWFRAVFLWSPVLAALILFATLGVYQKHERTVKGETAKRQLLMAIRIAGEKIHSAQVRVAKIDSERVVMQ